MNFSRNLALWFIIALLVFALFNLFQGSSPRESQKPMAYSDFVASVASGEVIEVTIQGQNISGNYRDGRPFATFAPEDPTLIAMLREKGVRVSAVPSDEDSPTLMSILISWFPMLIFLGFWIFFLRQMQSGGGKAMGFGKSRARLLTEKTGRITFDDVDILPAPDAVGRRQGHGFRQVPGPPADGKDGPYHV